MSVMRGPLIDEGVASGLIDRYQFCATMQLRTPLKYLAMHGQIVPVGQTLPVVPDRHGIWTVRTLTFRQLGIDVDEVPDSEMASEIGYIPTNGGDFLKLLERIREVAESEGPVFVRRRRLQSLLQVLPWPDLVDRLGGRAKILDRLFPAFLAQVPGLRARAADALAALGCTTPAKLHAMSDADMLAVPTLGPKSLVQLRAACAAAADADAEYVENIER